ncbi:hypothetical protein M5K25_018752 [Dendrobium thyrsiflorum]|uniref:FAR1 domain-containing protein n=1 Tax=Dendrobium thyrsiflorum TaxID=117978 RepID=A0ABD0UD06_DENTH
MQADDIDRGELAGFTGYDRETEHIARFRAGFAEDFDKTRHAIPSTEQNFVYTEYRAELGPYRVMLGKVCVPIVGRYRHAIPSTEQNLVYTEYRAELDPYRVMLGKVCVPIVGRYIHAIPSTEQNLVYTEYRAELGPYRVMLGTVCVPIDGWYRHAVPSTEQNLVYTEYRAELGPYRRGVYRSEKEAYEMYCEYAHNAGFSVRKEHHSYWPNSRIIKSKDFVCSKAGQKKGIDLNSQTKYRKSNTRTGCPAMIRFAVSQDRVWTV